MFAYYPVHILPHFCISLPLQLWSIGPQPDQPGVVALLCVASKFYCVQLPTPSRISFELKIVLILGWLPSKTREPSLFGYLTSRWRRGDLISLRGICAKTKHNGFGLNSNSVRQFHFPLHVYPRQIHQKLSFLNFSRTIFIYFIMFL